MRCAISSRAGQVLARGTLIIQTNEDGQQILVFQTDRGKLIFGGTINADGDLTQASEALFRQFYKTWGMTDMTLTSKPNIQSELLYICGKCKLAYTNWSIFAGNNYFDKATTVARSTLQLLIAVGAITPLERCDRIYISLIYVQIRNKPETYE